MSDGPRKGFKSLKSILPSSTDVLEALARDYNPEQAYARLALETRQLLFPSNFPHPWSTSADGVEKGSAAVIDFSSSQKPVVRRAKDAEDLRTHLDTPHPTASTQSSTSNRLIILEDLDQRYVNIIGAYIGVPPIVFLAHAAGPYVDDIVDEDCLAHDSSQYWRVKTFQLHGVDPHPKQAFGVYVGKDTVLDRMMQYLDGDRAYHPSAHLVSFWSTNNSDGSWTALLLVDPILENVIHKLHMTPPSDEPIYNLTLQHSDLSDDRIPVPARFSVERLHEDSQQWHKPPSRPLSLSFFDNLIHAYTYQGHATTSDPRSATDVIRKLLLSSWQGVIRSKEIDYYYLWSKTSFSKAHYTSGSSWYSAWENQWQREYFHALTYHMMTVMNRMKDLDDIFRTLYPTTTTASSFTLPPLPNGDSLHPNHNNNNNSSGSSGSNKNQNNTDDRERQSWHALRSHAHTLHARFAATLATYEQRAAIEQSLMANKQSVLSNEQSLLANKQARSVGRLSVLATMLVPFSVVAGIFSMSGRFAAGEDLFWVFWILAVSFSGGFVGWLFFERVVRALGSVMDRWGRMRGRSRRGEGKTKGQGAVLPVHEKDT